MRIGTAEDAAFFLPSSDDPRMIDRKALRADLRARRRALPAAERIAAATGVAASLAQLPEFLTDPRIAGYWATDGEVSLHVAVAALAARGQGYYLPCIGIDRCLCFAPWRPGIAIEQNRYGIPEPVCASDALLEPAALDVVLVPLLGFDRRGHRLGFGGGYYDRSFAFLRERREPIAPLLVGIGYAFQQIEAIEPAAWDVRLDYVATDRELIECVDGG